MKCKKQMHENVQCFYDRGGMCSLRMNMYVLEHIDEAVEEGWIQPYFQPCVDVHSGSVFQYEALARWEDPAFGLLTPDKFIPPLEDAFMVYKVDYAVLEQTCRVLKKKLEEGEQPVPFSFNISRADLEVCDVVRDVAAIADRWEIPHSYIHVEITESAVNTNRRLLNRTIEGLHKEGFEVWMDDFGTGYSSLNALREMPFDVVKVDLAFMKDYDFKSERIVEFIASMNQTLGMRTLVEGVETEEQYNSLRQIGCDLAQGYLFGKPASAQAVSSETFRPGRKAG